MTSVVCEDPGCPDFPRFPHSHARPLTVKIERELTPGEVENVAVTAYNGAIAYWANVEGISDEVRATYPDDFPLFEVNEKDGESERRGEWLDVTPEVIARGITLVLSGVTNEAAGRTKYGSYWASKPPAEWQFEPRQFADMRDFGAMDAEEADWVVQLGLFGHLVFG